MESESDDDDDDDEADQEWVRAQWASLVQRQRAREEHVRRLILSRNLLQPLVSRLLTDLILLLFFWGGGSGLKELNSPFYNIGLETMVRFRGYV